MKKEINLPKENGNIKVTIGLCVKNDESSIKKCLESILKQNFPKDQLELIIVDGNSTDRTMSIIKRVLSETDLKFLILRENIGLAFARQLVVDHAKGKYIIFIDGDMMFPSDYIAKIVQFMDANPNVGIAGGRFKMFMRKKAGIVYKLNYLEKTVGYYFGSNSSNCLIGTGGSIFRTKAIKEAGGFDIKIKGAGEDLELAYRIKMNGWKLYNTSNEFWDIPESDTGWKRTWKSLWKHNYWYGYNYYYVYTKHPKMFKLLSKIPIFSLIEGVLCFFKAFKVTRMKEAILLPIFFFFRQAAWIYAFAKAYLENRKSKSQKL